MYRVEIAEPIDQMDGVKRLVLTFPGQSAVAVRVLEPARPFVCSHEVIASGSDPATGSDRTVPPQPLTLSLSFTKPIRFVFGDQWTRFYHVLGTTDTIRLDRSDIGETVSIYLDVAPIRVALIWFEQSVFKRIRPIAQEADPSLEQIDLTGSEVPSAVQVLLEEIGTDALRYNALIRLAHLQSLLRGNAYEPVWYEFGPILESGS